MLRAIYFDAVGTLIHPRPAAAQVYVDVGWRFGCHLSLASCARRFRSAFQRQESIDRALGWATGERRERERWQTIVAEVLPDANDPAACFAELYEHFARPEAWVCEPGTEEVLAELRRRGFEVGLASNYDHRLHTVVAGLAPLRSVQHLVVSSEIGWRKPAPAFFAALCRQANLPAAQILYVGDDPVNDFEGARSAGLQACLVNPRDQSLALSVRRALGER